MNADMQTADDGSNSEMGEDEEEGDEFDIVILKNLAAQVRASLVIWQFKFFFFLFCASIICIFAREL